MPIYFKRESAFRKVPPLSPKIPQVPPRIFIGDIFGTDPELQAANPLSATMFFMKATESPEPAPPYEYDEAGIVVKGTSILTDETGTTVTLDAGDTFWVARGSTISFSAPILCACFKTTG
ncbi:ethanolamine utilization protein [Dactylonectria macrodidyma]|uniref:Ethanolamine utilization protein n=1 Tax=Dactylonectria macrodidyma TaxID=307937 RepID=A0A9P9JSC6_9HYPO|nr:ethanolamine utilization protein [Dactylonectria macrodidyma]